MKILIVDDEYYTVQLILSQIDWELLRIDTVLTAYNGEEALQLIEEEKPDIILCDIDMPKVDGIEVLRHISESGDTDRTQFIFLTCFDKFEYVQSALRLGAAEYLCKPFSETEVYAAIMKAKDRIEKRQQADYYDRLGRKWEEKQTNIDNQFLRDVVLQEISPSEQAIRTHMERGIYGFDPNKKYRLLLSCMSDQKLLMQPITDSVEKFVFRNMAGEIYQDNAAELKGIPIAWNSIYGILTTEETDDIGLLGEKILKLAEMAEKHMHIVFTCCVSEPVFLWEFGNTLEAMKPMAEEQFLNGVKWRLLSETAGDRKPETVAIDAKFICRCLERMDVNSIVEYLRQLFDSLSEGMQLDSAMIHQMNLDISQAIYSFCYENNIISHVLYQDEEIIMLQKRAEQMPYYLIRSVELICLKIVEILQNQQEKTRLFSEIDAYIRSHYREPISRESMAAELHYSINYFSRIFHTEMGMSFRDYINNYRLEEAKKLLKETDLPVGQIAMDVGFESMAYFSTVFKKNYGMTPLHWRNEACLKR